MPCYDPGASSAHTAELRKQVNDLTRWLCGVLTMIEASDTEFVMLDDELYEWWQTHKAWDEARKGTEQ